MSRNARLFQIEAPDAYFKHQKKPRLEAGGAAAHFYKSEHDPAPALAPSKSIPMERSSIHSEKPKPLVQGRRTIFDLPGELRNLIFSFTIGQMSRHMPLDPFYSNNRSPYAGILLASSQVYHEARSYIMEKEVVYIPVMMGMDWSYGEPASDYPYLRATKDTIAAALTESMNTHFHLHVDVLKESDYKPSDLLASLTQAIEVFRKASWDLYVKHDLRKRHAVVHLDHMLTLWPRFYRVDRGTSIGFIKSLIDILVKDPWTDWELRYYVATGQLGAPRSYANYSSHITDSMRDIDLAELRGHGRRNGGVKVVAEIYGEDTKWDFGDDLKCVSRTRTPATEMWPNTHFDPSKYRFRNREQFQISHPPRMPHYAFDEDVLKARGENSVRRVNFLEQQSEQDLVRGLGNVGRRRSSPRV